MDVNPPRSKPLALVPLDEAPFGDDSARPTGKESSAVERLQRGRPVAAAADEFLAQAAKEYQEGRIDQALWDRTSAQFDGDEALLVAAYLRIRARALKQKRRDKRAEEQTRTAGSMRGASDPKVEVQSRPEAVSTKAAWAGHFTGQPKIKYAVTAVALAAAVAVLWLVASPRDSESISRSIAVAAAAKKPAASPKSLASEQTVVKDASDSASEGSPGKALETRVQELEKAGNWNVLVLYASEWTRKEPDNAAAWTQLSIGYGKLRQLGDALEAATRAVQLSPEDSRHWRNIGHVYLALERFPEARIAFDNVLAVSAEDADALCGAALVAKGQGRAKEADGIAARLKSIEGSCDGASDAVSSAVVAGDSAARKTVPSRSR